MTLPSLHFTNLSPPGETNRYEGESRTALVPRPRSSRYRRPAELPPLRLQPRDRQVFAAVYDHRYLSAEHLRTLIFPATSLRMVQERLRKLWAHRYLDRRFLPHTPDGVHPTPTISSRPFYMLARGGAAELALLREDLPLSAIPQTPRANACGYATLAHHLVATDFLVALQSACCRRTEVALLSFEREHTLQERLLAWRARERRAGFVLLPDGAFSLSYPSLKERSTFYLEVIRSGVKGGNLTLVERMKQYVIANRAGILRRLYGHDQLRAVLILTTSRQRAEHFRALAATLSHGRRLFWFGVYQGKDDQGRSATTLAPETILLPRWQTADGQLVSLLPPDITLIPTASAPLCAGAANS